MLDSSRADFSESLTGLARDLKATWAADAVAGSMTGILAACMPSGSTIAVYGVLSGGEATVNPGDLIFRGQSVSGYWVSASFRIVVPSGSCASRGFCEVPVGCSPPTCNPGPRPTCHSRISQRACRNCCSPRAKGKCISVPAADSLRLASLVSGGNSPCRSAHRRKLFLS